MKVSDRSQVAAAVVRHDLLPITLRQDCDLPQPGNALRHQAFRLQNVIDAALAHPSELMQAAVIFSPRQRQRHQPAELRQLIKSVSRERLLETIAVQAFEFSRTFQGATKIPEHSGLPAPGGLCLIGVRHYDHLVPDSRPHSLHRPDVFLKGGMVQA